MVNDPDAESPPLLTRLPELRRQILARRREAREARRAMALSRRDELWARLVELRPDRVKER